MNQAVTTMEPECGAIPLSKPLATHEGDIRVLKLREPTAADFIEINVMPYDTKGQGDAMQASINHRAALQWLSRLSGVDEILLKKMGKRDWLACTMRLTEFLVEEGDTPGN